MRPAVEVACDEATARADGAAPGAWWFLFLLSLAFAVQTLDRTLVAIMIEPIRAAFRLNDRQMGLLTGMAYGAAFALAALPAGWLVDRRDRRRFLALALAGWSLMTALLRWASGYPVLLGIRMLVGAAQSGANPAALSIIGDLFPASRRFAAVGIYYLGPGLGATAAALGGSYLVHQWGWRTTCLALGLPGVAVALLLAVTTREPKRGAADGAHTGLHDAAPPLGQVFRHVLGHPPLRHLMLAMTLGSLSLSASGTWIMAYLLRVWRLDIRLAGLAVAVLLGVGFSLGGWLGGALANHFGRRGVAAGVRVAAATCAGSALAIAAGLLAPTAPLAIAGLFVSSVLGAALYSPGNATIIDVTRPEMRGVVTAMNEIGMNFVGYGVGPMLVGVLSDAYGGPRSLVFALITVVGLSMAWASLHFLIAARNIVRAR